jgi:hypothetical protein
MQRLQQRRRGYPLLVFFTIVVIVLIATILPVSRADAHAHEPEHERTDCDGAALVRRLLLIDEGQNDPVTLDTAIAEAEAIWATAGVRLVWMPTAAGAAPPDAYVVLRGGRPNVVKEAALMKSSGVRQLGWVRYERDGRRANLIEVSLPAVRSTLVSAWHGDRLFRFHPPPAQAPLFGRALGRIIAHEIGHWLVGLGHTKTGLMQPILKPRDLMHDESPRLPSAWTDATDTRLAALRALCK